MRVGVLGAGGAPGTLIEQAELNDAIRALDPEARDVQCRVLGMAGAAPGPTGALATHVVDRAAGQATKVDVCLLQSAAGTAGRQGTIEMLDLLTARGVTYRDRIVLHPDRSAPDTMSAFDLRNAEPAAPALEPAHSLATTFDGPILDRAVRALTPRTASGPPDARGDRLQDVAA